MGEVVKEIGGSLSWVVSSFTEFVSVANGEFMAPLLMCLLRLERIFLEKGVKAARNQSIPAVNRPVLVSTWITAGRCDRKGGKNMEVTNGHLSKFKAEVQKWWDTMQPGWRVKDMEGRWEKVAYKGKWSHLVSPGRNGMLSIIATLSWWGRKIGDGVEKDEWKMMVEDVKWVLDGLIAEVEQDY